MKRINPKSHDSLVKWLITSFTEEFFAHYFPGIRIGLYSFIDKEFIRKYEALKESLKGDLFLLMEVEIDGGFQEIAIQIEHQSEREDVSERVFEYLCYVWLLKKKPVWSMVIYTDDVLWKKSVSEKFWYAFEPEHQKQFFRFSVIKIKAEKSRDLINKHSLLCKLLSLKADDEGTDPEKLIYEIYHSAAQMKTHLTADQLLLINQWVDFYKKISEKNLVKIKKEVNMELVETTISEHIFNQGILHGKAEGKTEGKAEGIIEGQLAVLETLFRQGILSEEQTEYMTAPLRQKLKELTEKQSLIEPTMH